MAIAVYAARAKNKTLIGLLRNQLINPALSDDVKIRIFSLLVETGEITDHSEVSVVYSNIFKKSRRLSPRSVRTFRLRSGKPTPTLRGEFRYISIKK